jgi:pimeloyl-ACP methyl ester carboxylesterase
MWKYQLDALAEEARVIAPDLRGFGKSGVAAGTVTMERYADDLAALLEALNISQKVIFCGLSMGGYIAWQFWRRHPARVGKLILCDTRAIPDTADAAKTRLTTAERVETTGTQALAELMMGKLFAPDTVRERGDDVEAMRQVILSCPPQGAAAALRGMAERPDATALLRSISVPTEVIVGEHDAISPPDEMRGIADAIPQARFVEIAGAGHMSPLEKPDEVNAVIRALLHR